MNKNISEEKIEIGGKEYTLFINRTAIVNWEKMTKLTEKVNTISNNVKSEDIEITNDTNPFEMYGTSEEDIDKEYNELVDIYAKFYWVALYTHHKLNIEEARKLFDIAVEEYGIDQLGELANQMVENANTDRMNRKNLKALKSTKKN